MRPFSIDWREVLAAIAIFVVAMLTFALLSGAAGWPNATSGWPLAVGVALALALLRATGPALDYLQQVGAKVETPFLKLDFAGVARVAGAPGQPWVLSDDLIRKSPSIPDSALPELERSVENFVNQAEIVVDLEDGGAWYTTRIFAVAATAMEIGSPQSIILIGQRNGIPRQFGGWVKPADIVTAFSRRDERFATVHGQALQYLAHLRAHSADFSYTAAPASPGSPSQFPRYQNYVAQFRTYGDIALIRILVDQMLNPEKATPNEALEKPQQPPWTNLGELERLLDPWLVSDQVKVEQAPKEQVMQVLGSHHDLIASTRNGRFIGMIDVRRVERDIVRQLVERAPA
jgi:hypothetical protein